MTTQTPAVVDLGSIVSAADAQLSAMVQQATADVPSATPSLTPEPTPTPTPLVEAAPVTAPVETAQPTPAPTASDSVYTLDLSKLSPEQRRDFQDAVAKEGDPAKVASRYWEFNRRLGKNGDAAPVQTEPTPPVQQEPIAAPPQEVIANEVRERLFTDPDVSQWRYTYAENKAQLGELLKIDPALPKPEFDANLNARYNNLGFEIRRLTQNLSEAYVKENPDVEQGIRANLVDLKSSRAEIDRIRMQNDLLDTRFAEKAKTYQQSVSEARRQEYESQQAATRAERDIEQYAERFDRAWPTHITNVAKANQIGDEIAAGFNRMARYEVLGMINREEIIDEGNLPQILDKLAKQYLSEVDASHRYSSRVYAQRANANAEAPIIIPPNAVAQDTNTRPLMSRQEIDSAHDALLRKTLGEMALR